MMMAHSEASEFYLELIEPWYQRYVEPHFQAYDAA